MDDYAFTLNGKRFRISRRRVIEALRHVTPEPVRTHGVEVAGRLFPVKQALAETVGVDRQEFISTRARDILKSVGFRVVTGGDVRALHAGSARQETPGVDTSARGAALEHAIRLYAERTDATPQKIVEAAQLFTEWLRGNDESVQNTEQQVKPKSIGIIDSGFSDTARRAGDERPAKQGRTPSKTWR